MSEDVKDLLDLCRLNLMEERVAESLEPDRDATLQAIEWKRRQLARKIIDQQEAADPPSDEHAESGERKP